MLQLIKVTINLINSFVEKFQLFIKIYTKKTLETRKSNFSTNSK